MPTLGELKKILQYKKENGPMAPMEKLVFFESSNPGQICWDSVEVAAEIHHVHRWYAEIEEPITNPQMNDLFKQPS